MRELYIRSFTGILYSLTIIACLIIGPLAFSILIFSLSCFALFEFQRLINKINLFPYLILGILIFGLLAKKIPLFIFSIILIPTLIYQVLLINWVIKTPNLKFSIPLSSYVYFVFCSFFLIAIPFAKGNFDLKLMLIVFILTWLNNSSAYIIGKNFGKNKLLPKVSPKKSWEGFWAGLISCIVLSPVFFYLIKPNLSFALIFIFSIIIPILATLGDLIQSKFKRTAGVKDSGSLLPGHGGFYDRMDSIIFVSPWIYFLLSQL